MLKKEFYSHSVWNSKYEFFRNKNIKNSYSTGGIFWNTVMEVQWSRRGRGKKAVDGTDSRRKF